MTDRQRIALFIFILGALVFLGLLFAPFVIANILTPLSLVVWLFLRIFVLSIGQAYYWGFFILVGLFWLARRFIGARQEQRALPVVVTNDVMRNVEKWRSIIFVSASYPEMRQQLRNELVQMIISLFSSRQQASSFADVYEPLRQRQIPLPDPVYDFLFAPEPENTRLTFIQKLRAVPELPRKWWRSWSGQETAEYHRSIDAVLNFMETTLEIPHDDEPRNHSND